MAGRVAWLSVGVGPNIILAALLGLLDQELADFYLSLLKSESRHFSDYLKLAEELSSEDEVARRLPVFLELERELIESPDTELRLHSGVPAAS